MPLSVNRPRPLTTRLYVITSYSIHYTKLYEAGVAIELEHPAEVALAKKIVQFADVIETVGRAAQADEGPISERANVSETFDQSAFHFVAK